MTVTQHMAMLVNSAIRKQLFARPSFIRACFGLRVVAPSSMQSRCEWGTLALRHLLARYVRPGLHVLEVGTGANALLSISIKRHWPSVTVVATDILPERVQLGRRTAEHNRASIDFRQTSLFDGIDERFDIVLFNPPAIPTRKLADLGFTVDDRGALGARRCWSGDGGEDGLEIVRDFLSALPDRLAPHGRALLSINPAHCAERTFRMLAQSHGVEVERTHHFLGINNTYLLRAGGRSTPR